MAMKNITSRVNAAGVGKFVGLSGNKVINVAGRKITTPAASSFSNSSAVSQRLEMRRMQSKINTGLYDNNEIAKRRLQDKIADHASEVYGLDKSKLTRTWQGTGAGDFSSNVRQVDPGRGADLLENKVNTPFSTPKKSSPDR